MGSDCWDGVEGISKGDQLLHDLGFQRPTSGLHPTDLSLQNSVNNLE